MPYEHLELLEKNKIWVQETLELEPDYFNDLSKGQAPKFLWVGCSDSRVPAIVTSGDPKYVYENPKNTYVASLFGDVNAIQMNGETQLIFPHQLQVVTASDWKVTIVNSYFRGSHYLIEATFENQTIFFESKKEYPKATEVCLKKIDS